MALEEDAAQVLGQKVCWLVVRRAVPGRYNFLNNQLADVVEAQSNMLGSAVTHSTCRKRDGALVVFEYHCGTRQDHVEGVEQHAKVLDLSSHAVERNILCFTRGMRDVALSTAQP